MPLLESSSSWTRSEPRGTGDGMAMSAGDLRITHTRSGASGKDETVVAEFDRKGVVVTWPRVESIGAHLSLESGPEVPEPLILRDTRGWITLREGHRLGKTASTLAHSEERIRYWTAVGAGYNGRSYSEVHGMASEVDGLMKWAKLVPVTQSVFFEENGRVRSISMEAKNEDPVLLGGSLGLRLLTSYRHQPFPTDGRYGFDTSLQVRTRSDELLTWSDHRSTHQLVQDLMTLVYGRPCSSRLVSVMREDDQEREPVDERRSWREVYEPSFGRGESTANTLSPKAEPLFYLDEADPEKIHMWLSESGTWGRATGIAVAALFHGELPVESRLIQVAVALEALGYAIARHRHPDQRPPRAYVSKLDLIFETLGFLPTSVLGAGGSRAAWVTSFTRAYNGVKHADNELTEPLVAWELADQGVDLFRCWLAVYLGVAPEVIDERLKPR